MSIFMTCRYLNNLDHGIEKSLFQYNNLIRVFHVNNHKLLQFLYENDPLQFLLHRYVNKFAAGTV